MSLDEANIISIDDDIDVVITRFVLILMITNSTGIPKTGVMRRWQDKVSQLEGRPDVPQLLEGLQNQQMGFNLALFLELVWFVMLSLHMMEVMKCSDD